MTEKINIPQGYKNSPLGIIPKEWEVKRLGEVCTKITDGTHGTPQKQNVGVPYLTAIHVKDGIIDYDNCYFLTQKDHNEIYQRCNPEFGDVLMVNIGAGVGSVAMNKVEYEFSLKNVALLKPNKEILTGYFLESYLLASKSKNIHRLLNGGAQPFFGLDDIARIHILLPSLIEQNRLESIISLWDTAIEKQSELIKKLRLRKHALMQQLLTGKKRLPGFSGEWKRIKLGDIAERITRKNEEDNKNVVTISAQRGFVVQTDFFNKSVASEVLDNYFLVYKDEFCYNKSYSNGYPMGAIKRLKSFDKAVVTTLYICFKLKNMASVNIDFFEQYCESGIFNKELIKVANEGGRAHGLLNVTPADFFNMHMRIPNIDEQNAIAILLVNADKEIELAKEKLASLQSQKQGLMQQLLTGKKRIMQL